MNAKQQSLVIFVLILSLALSGCGSERLVKPTLPPSATITPTLPPTQTSVPQGKILLVTNTDDSGTGSFRQAMLEAQPYDTITFDPDVFPPDSPAAIMVTSPLPEINKDYLTIAASNAGVILDGGGNSYGALSINTKYITIQGLYIVNFEGTAITLWENAHHNTIGGDPQLGAGPLGQGNLITGNRDGIIIQKGGSHHTIAGNQIGVEFNGFVGNTYCGIQILDQSPGNIIGPGNVVAYSGAPSIEIKTNQAQYTTITRNLIYGEPTVLLMIPQAIDHPVAPVILSFDPAGTVSGVACPECEVEIFSGEDRWAEFYEGSMTAGPDGNFTFTADTPFSGANVKATATTPSGSTSNFSVPTPGESWTFIMQERNTLPASVLYSLSSEEIGEENRIGTHVWFPYCQENAVFLQSFNGLGYGRVRLSFNEMEVPYALERSEIPSIADFEPCIDFFLSRGMEISYILSFWDKQTQLAGEEVPCERFTNVGEGDPETERYLEFVRSVVPDLMAHGIHQYEIWNEPNTNACTQAIEAQDYVNLVRRVVPVIRQEYPEAKIVVGAVTWLHDPSSQNYLMAIAGSDIMPMVDAISWHPFYGASPAYADVAEYYNTYPTLVQQIKTRAFESGFMGEFWADEMTWRTPAFSNPDHPWNHDEFIAAKYYARSIVMHLGMDVSPAVDVDSRLTIVYSTVRNLATVMAGLRPIELAVEIESEATSIMSNGFILPNGDKLFALWTNGTAVGNDPGVNATLTFPGLSAQKVVGVDVLHGFEQELVITNTGSGDLVIRNLLVKDYPIIIKFTDTTP